MQLFKLTVPGAGIKLRGRWRFASKRGGCFDLRFSLRFNRLGIVLVEIKRGVEIGLARQQFLKARLILEGMVALDLIIGKRFFKLLQLQRLLPGESIETAHIRGVKTA